MTNRKTLIGICLFLLLVGIGLLVWGGYSFSIYLRRKETYVKTYAVVVDYYVKGDSYDGYFDEDETYSPIIEYEAKGNIYRKRLDESSNPPKYLIGQTVLIRYNPKNPDMYILEFDMSFIWMEIIGLLFTVCGVVVLVKGIKKKRN